MEGISADDKREVRKAISIAIGIFESYDRIAVHEVSMYSALRRIYQDLECQDSNTPED